MISFQPLVETLVSSEDLRRDKKERDKCEESGKLE